MVSGDKGLREVAGWRGWGNRQDKIALSQRVVQTQEVASAQRGRNQRGSPERKGYFHLLRTAPNNQGTPRHQTLALGTSVRDTETQGPRLSLDQGWRGWRGSKALYEPFINTHGGPGERVQTRDPRHRRAEVVRAFRIRGYYLPSRWRRVEGWWFQRFPGCFSPQGPTSENRVFQALHCCANTRFERRDRRPCGAATSSAMWAAPPKIPLVLKTRRVILNRLLSLQNESRCLLAQEGVIR